MSDVFALRTGWAQLISELCVSIDLDHCDARFPTGLPVHRDQACSFEGRQSAVAGRPAHAESGKA